ncbi:MAG: 1-phosphofructokinase family hexose kinase [Candidatus Margulisiibacteriota bacterium]
MITTITLNPALDKLYLINNFQLHKLHRLGDLIRIGASPGGKGINVAIFLQRMGIEATVMGFLGGHTGQVVEQMAREENVTTNFVFVENETRIDITIIDEKNDTLTEINESGPPIFKEDLDSLLKRYARILDDSELVVLSGSLPPNVPQDIYATMINMANQKNVKTIINAAKAPLELGIEAGPTVVYPDMRSAYNMYGIKTETIEDYAKLAQMIKEKNPKIEMVVFSNPIRNIFVANIQGKNYQAKIAELKNVNMFGFGDALVGGLAIGLQKNRPMIEVLRSGFASGLVNLESIKKQLADKALIEDTKARVKIVEIP